MPPWPHHRPTCHSATWRMEQGECLMMRPPVSAIFQPFSADSGDFSRVDHSRSPGQTSGPEGSLARARPLFLTDSRDRLLRGETGIGQGLVARISHDRRPLPPGAVCRGQRMHDGRPLRRMTQREVYGRMGTPDRAFRIRRFGICADLNIPVRTAQ